MVTPDNLGNQNITFFKLHRLIFLSIFYLLNLKITFLKLNGLILKVTKFRLSPPKRLSIVVKNIFFFGGGAIMPPPPMLNRVKAVCKN